jgi:hypothetical protein
MLSGIAAAICRVCHVGFAWVKQEREREDGGAGGDECTTTLLTVSKLVFRVVWDRWQGRELEKVWWQQTDMTVESNVAATRA